MARILIANDNEELLSACKEVLEGAGHVVRFVTGGALALDLAREWYPDAVLVDWKMPDTDGTVVVRALRGDPATASIPILMMSGTVRGPEIALQAGADGFLPKPFSGRELVAAINDLLALATKAGVPT